MTLRAGFFDLGFIIHSPADPVCGIRATTYHNFVFGRRFFVDRESIFGASSVAKRYARTTKPQLPKTHIKDHTIGAVCVATT
jgi:hypothetical protein